MAKNKISEFSSTPANNTDIANINIAEGCAPSGINNAIRELMAQLKDQQTGADGDNFTVGGNLSVTGTTTLTGTTSAPTVSASDDSTKIATTAFVRDIIPSGVIVMWSGSVATIPTGWLLCDGANSTPDLRNRFIIGANADDAGVAKTNVTGSATQTGGSKDAIVVSHTHTESNPGNFITGDVTFDTGSQSGILGNATGVFSRSNLNNENVAGGQTAAGLRGLNLTITAGSHTHTIDATGSSGTNANLVPYYSLAYIMKS
jgi:hypothetical protein